MLLTLRAATIKAYRQNDNGCVIQLVRALQQMTDKGMHQAISDFSADIYMMYTQRLTEIL